jgi:Pyruvate/2-oxoacid:ferredoxin oxidoreductase gamma subunit
VDLPLEIRVHGRGGQGGVTCAKLIAALYARMGLAVQTFGDYGSERSGAPVQAFSQSVHLVVHPSDLPNLTAILRKSTVEFDLLYKVYKDAVAAHTGR